jgi:autotransporter-associated beta strand protein
VFLDNTANTYSGATNINGGILNVAALANGGAASSIGQAGTAANLLNIANGTLQYTGSTPQSTNKLFTIGVGGATLDASGSGAGTMTFAGPGTLGVAGGTVAKTLTLTGTNTGANTLAAVIPVQTGSLGAVNVLKNGAGTWSLTAANTYTGGTTIDQGTLAANNTTGSATGTGPVLVNAGGTLGGTGSVSGTITLAGGSLAPGNSIGTLSGTSANLSNGTLKIEIDSNPVVPASDKLTLSSGLTLGGINSVLQVTDLGSTLLTPGTKLTFASYGSLNSGGLFSVGGNVVNDFDTNPLDVFTVGVNTFGIDYNDGGNNISLVAAVPEPGTIGSLIGGFGVLLGLRRRKSRRA